MAVDGMMEIIMEYRTSSEVGRLAKLYSEAPQPKVMTRAERLERWAALLSEEPRRNLRTLHETEYQPIEARDRMRCDNSPLSVAAADAVLRRQGLEGDTYGDAKRFFDLSDRELHGIVCFCHWGATMTASAAALRVRAVARGGFGVFTRAWHTLTG